MTDYIKRSDAIHAVLHNSGQAAVAAVQEIEAEDVVPETIFDKIIDELELHMYRIEGQDDLLYPLTPRQMTMNSTFEIAIDVIEKIRKEQTDETD